MVDDALRADPPYRPMLASFRRVDERIARHPPCAALDSFGWAV